MSLLQKLGGDGKGLLENMSEERFRSSFQMNIMNESARKEFDN